MTLEMVKPLPRTPHAYPKIVANADAIKSRRRPYGATCSLDFPLLIRRRPYGTKMVIAYMLVVRVGTRSKDLDDPLRHVGPLPD